jgi:hypothetical protein
MLEDCSSLKDGIRCEAISRERRDVESIYVDFEATLLEKMSIVLIMRTHEEKSCHT